MTNKQGTPFTSKQPARAMTDQRRAEIYSAGYNDIIEAMKSARRQSERGRSASMNGGYDSIGYAVDAVIRAVEAEFVDKKARS